MVISLFPLFSDLYSELYLPQWLFAHFVRTGLKYNVHADFVQIFNTGILNC